VGHAECGPPLPVRPREVRADVIGRAGVASAAGVIAHALTPCMLYAAQGFAGAGVEAVDPAYRTAFVSLARVSAALCSASTVSVT